MQATSRKKCNLYKKSTQNAKLHFSLIVNGEDERECDLIYMEC